MWTSIFSDSYKVLMLTLLFQKSGIAERSLGRRCGCQQSRGDQYSIRRGRAADRNGKHLAILKLSARPPTFACSRVCQCIKNRTEHSEESNTAREGIRELSKTSALLGRISAEGAAGAGPPSCTPRALRNGEGEDPERAQKEKKKL